MHEVISGERHHVAITIYNQGTSLVQDRRKFTLAKGANHLSFTDVAEQIDATSVQFLSRTDPAGTGVIEQNYAYDLVDLFALLRRYIDQNVEIITEDGTLYSGVLLSGRNEIILRADNGQIVAIARDKVRDLRFPDLPGGLITRPTLRWLLESEAGGDQELELTYLTGGLNWTADYVVLLSGGKDALDLNGWITVNNTSGAAYEQAQVKLVAGDVHRIEADMVMFDASPKMLRAAAPAPAVEQREFFEYQLYEIKRPVTVADNEQKQVEFARGAGVKGRLIYTAEASRYFNLPKETPAYVAGEPLQISQYLEFSTGRDGGLDADLPQGRVRVYQRDTDDAALLIGEDRIKHTPKGETVRLKLGSPFDLVGERTQTDYRVVSKSTVEEAWKLKITNRKDTDTVEVRIVQKLYRFNEWKVMQSSQPYEKLDANTLLYTITVPPQDIAVVEYRMRYSW
ncbi:MAG: hypothetical protein IAE89_03775 [Anaerolineae bacterium]|nr:hypothetical protein [Anaerolineae bacterium]